MKQFFTIFMCMFCIISSCFCVWEKPQLIRKNDVTSKPSLFADNNSGKTYVFYSVQKNNGASSENYICFKIYQRGDFITPREQCIRQQYQAVDVSVTGSIGNMTSLFLAFSATRRSGGSKCESGLTDGCNDIFIMESNDEGQTWSNPIPVPRTDMNDPANRKLPAILYIAEIGRLFIAYCYEGAYIRFVTRPKGSQIFQNEAIINYQRDPELTDLVFAYTYSNGNLALHMFIQKHVFETPSIVWFGSTDNGVTWHWRWLRSNEWPFKYSMSPSWKHNKVYLATVGNTGAYELIWVDSNLQFTERRIPYDASVSSFSPMICDIPDSDGLFVFTGVNEDKKVTTFTYNTNSGVFVDQKDIAPERILTQSAAIVFENELKVRTFHIQNGDLYL